MPLHPAGSPSLLRAINERAILQLFSAGRLLTRGDVATSSGLSKPTVSAALTHLVAGGLLAEAGQVTGRKGPAAQRYRLASDAYLGVGVDIGRQSLRLGVVDAHGEQRIGLADRTPDTVTGIATALGRLADRAAAALGVPRTAFLRTVVGVPGAVDPQDQGVRYAGGLPEGGAGLAEALAAVFGDEVALENDINLCAIVEGRAGAAAGMDDFVFLGLSSGIGMGIVLNGRLHRGATGAAGEIGFVPSPAHLLTGAPAAGRHPLVDDVVGTDRIREVARAHGLGDVEPPQVFDLARAGNAAAGAVVDDTCRTLAWIVATVLPVLDPELVVIGGPVGGNGDLLIEPVRRHLRALTPLTPRVIASGLGAQSVLLGALAVAEDLARETAFALATAVAPPDVP